MNNMDYKQHKGNLRGCIKDIVERKLYNKRIRAETIHIDNSESQLIMPDVVNRYLVEYLNKGGANRQTYIEAINEDAARKGFFIFNY